MSSNTLYWNAELPRKVAAVVNYVTGIDKSVQEPEKTQEYKGDKYFYTEKSIKSADLLMKILSSLSIYTLCTDMQSKGSLSYENLKHAIISIILSFDASVEAVETYLTDKLKEELAEMIRLCSMPGQTVNATTDFSTIVTENTDFDYVTFYNRYTTDDKIQVGYTLLKDGQRLRREQKGTTYKIMTLTKNVFPILFATEGTLVNKDSITYSRAVNLTSLDVAKKMVENNDVSKLGANIGWGSLYRYWDKLTNYVTKKNNGIAVPMEKWYIPLVTIPRARPSALTKKYAENSSYLYLIFSILNDAYLLHKGSIKEAGFTFNIATKLSTNEIQYDPILLAKIIPKFMEICFAHMKHKSEIPVEIRNAIDSCIKALQEKNYATSGFDEDDYWTD